MLILTQCLFFITLFTNIMQQLFSLLMVTNHAHGGYSTDGNEIGTIFMVAAVCEFTWQVSFYNHFYCPKCIGLVANRWDVNPQYSLHYNNYACIQCCLHEWCDFRLVDCFLILMQLSGFPLTVKCIGYRWTLRLGLVLFAVSCVLLPFSSQIAGPIPNTSVLNASLVYSGSGFQNSTGFDFCGNDVSEEMYVNTNSVKRSPINVWVVVIVFLSLMEVSRYVNSWYCMHAARSMYCVLRVSKAICQAITFAPMQDGELCYSCSSHRQLNSGKY